MTDEKEGLSAQQRPTGFHGPRVSGSAHGFMSKIKCPDEVEKLYWRYIVGVSDVFSSTLG